MDPGANAALLLTVTVDKCVYKSSVSSLVDLTDFGSDAVADRYLAPGFSLPRTIQNKCTFQKRYVCTIKHHGSFAKILGFEFASALVIVPPTKWNMPCIPR